MARWILTGGTVHGWALGSFLWLPVELTLLTTSARWSPSVEACLHFLIFICVYFLLMRFMIFIMPSYQSKHLTWHERWELTQSHSFIEVLYWMTGLSPQYFYVYLIVINPYFSFMNSFIHLYISNADIATDVLNHITFHLYIMYISIIQGTLTHTTHAATTLGSMINAWFQSRWNCMAQETSQQVWSNLLWLHLEIDIVSQHRYIMRNRDWTPGQCTCPNTASENPHYLLKRTLSPSPNLTPT